MSLLAGKVAFVSGGARGIGAACGAAMSAQGARVVLADLPQSDGEATAAALQAKGQQALFVPLDVTDEAGWTRAMEAVAAKYGRLDVMVNNAGITLSKTVEDISLQEFKRVLDINLLGVFLGTQNAIRLMKKSGGGSIINIASNSTDAVVPLTTAYSPSKAAVANFTKVAAVHCAVERYNIRVNSVHPGPTETLMLTGGGAMRAADIPQVRALIDAIPMGRMAQPEEIGNVVLFLASDLSSYMTAAEIFVDGGLTVRM